MFKQLFRTKSLERIAEESAHSAQHGLKRSLKARDLVALGIGAVIGAGIFATTGTAAAGGANHLGAGPAVILCYVLVAITCSFCALCYAEFASMIPIAGSAYTYAYATLGEVVAWIIGWDLILEYAVGNVAVAISWSGYFGSLIRGLGLPLPDWILTATQSAPAQVMNNAPHVLGIPIVFNLPAILIVVALTWLLVRGIRESAHVNNGIVLIKLLVVFFVIGLGAFYVDPANWHPFAPNGWAGIKAGAALIFFAYIGFDAVSTAAEETEDPGRDLPIGMIGSLVICTILYVLVAAVLTGLVPYTELGTAEPMATAFEKLGMHWASGLIAFGALISMTAVLLVFQMGQPRIFFSMARDGLLPRFFGQVHPKYRTPHVTTILTGAAVAITAGFMDINAVIELCNIGTLFAFVLVCAGVIVLRRTRPAAPRPFRTPLVPWIPILGILSCGYLMAAMPLVTWVRFGIWLVLGMVIYLLYGMRHSRILEPVVEEVPAGFTDAH
ncbi:MAG: amino acid permease [Burkholderiales bacterium]|nr:amino acid permease [Burkholderiales bacterium]